MNIKIFEFTEESSFYDPKSTWNHGGEYYETTFRCLIPVDMEDDEEIERYIEQHQEDEDVFWLEDRHVVLYYSNNSCGGWICHNNWNK